MYPFHLFFISSAFTRSISFLTFTGPVFGQNVTLIFSIFLTRSLVFPLLLLYSSFIHCSLKKAFLSLHPILWNSAFNWIYLSLSFSLAFHFSYFFSYLQSPQTTTLPSCFPISLDGFVHCLLCDIVPTSVHSSSGTLFTRSNPLNLLVTFTAYS